MKLVYRTLAVWLLLGSGVAGINGQHSVARQWNDALLDAIRTDYARPTVHARNLFHTSMAMYDAWAVYDEVAQPFFLGKSLRNFYCPFEGVNPPVDVKSAQEEAVSYAVYRVLRHRFALSPNAVAIREEFDNLMLSLGYDTSYVSFDYINGPPAALGNYIAREVIAFGLQDGSNEQNEYGNIFYEPVNDPLIPVLPGNPDMTDPNRWQPLTLDVFIDQGGNVIPISTPSFLSPEWGQVVPFALGNDDLTINSRDGFDYWVYHDPGAPPHIDIDEGGGLSDEYKWNFALVSIWSSHLDPSDGVMIDISPASFGNNAYEDYPTTIEGLRDYYDLYEGGDTGQGWDMNPVTGMPYEPQIVPRGDYTRVLAEFWADGPDSETPPGHWFTILNYVNDHPQFEKKFMGEGPVLDELEWDVKAYFTLAGTVHDAAVTAWGIKGWYDYLRPISAIRYMADLGQSTDPGDLSYHPGGIPIHPGYIELVRDGDPLAGEENENVGKIKLYAWRGPDYIDDPEVDEAGVGWILAENWWPYQRPTFITPPFAGYISGHSTFSRAAAEVMTLLTGSAFFPGGMGEFHAARNEFLVFEEGPSVDVTLQWATYRDASDQTSLSRLWGGIHPPVDDIPGRLIGIDIGLDAFELALCHFQGPQYEYDTVELFCSPVKFELPIQDEQIDTWSWIVSIDGSVSGASSGSSEGGEGQIQILEITSGDEATVTYLFDGHIGNCESVIRQVIVRLKDIPEPVADFEVEILDSVIFISNYSTDASTYSWDFGDGTTDSSEEPEHVYTSPGVYPVQLIVTNECGSDTLVIEVQISTSAVDDITLDRYFRVLPNPNNGQFYLEPKNIEGEFKVTVFNVMGQIVFREKTYINGPMAMDLSVMNSGMYYAAIENDNIHDVVKIVVQE